MKRGTQRGGAPKAAFGRGRSGRGAAAAAAAGTSSRQPTSTPPVKLRRSPLGQQKQAEATQSSACRALFQQHEAGAGSSSGHEEGALYPAPSLVGEPVNPLTDLFPDLVEVSEVQSEKEDSDVGQEEEQAAPETYSPQSVLSSTHSLAPEVTPQSEGAGRPSVSPQKRQASKVWDHFEVGVDSRFAVCRHCKMSVSRGKMPGHFTTTNLTRHMQRHHQSVLLGTEAGTSQQTGASGKGKQKAPATSASSRPPIPKRLRQATMEEMGWGKYGATRWRFPAPNQITNCIGEMVALDDQPFSLVENAGFKRLMALVVPYYKPPCRTTLSRRVVPSLYQACRELVLGRLCQAEAQKVHFTSDIWSSEGGVHAYLSLTAHWWGASGQEAPRTSGTGKEGCRWALLHTAVMDQSHTAEEITEAMNRMVAGWLGGHQHTRGYMVTDGGANMLKAVRDGGFEGIRCIAHVFNLVVRDGLGGSKAPLPPQIRNLLESCRKVAGHFHHSVKGSRLLREKQQELGLPQHRLVQDVATRWNSTYHMLERMVEQQRVVHEMFRVGDIGIQAPLSRQQWEAMSQLLVVLKPFLEATETLSSSTALLSQVLPVARHLQNQMGEFLEAGDAVTGRRFLPEVREVVTRLRESLSRRVQPLYNERQYMLATMCDPRIKDGLCGQTSRAGWVEMLVTDVRAAQDARIGQAEEEASEAQALSPLSTTSSGGSSTTTPSRGTGQGFWDKALQAAVGHRGTQPSRRQDDAAAAVQRYLAEQMEDGSIEPLAYWSSRRQMWPDLARVAMDRISCPPSSVPSERVFSMAGDVVTPHRSRLDAEIVEQLVFLKVNLPLLGYPTLMPSGE